MRIYICGLVLLICVATLGLADSDHRYEAEFEWFDGLGFPSLKGRPFVRVSTGRWMASAPDPPENSFIHAFLLDEQGETFRVLRLDLHIDEFKKTPEGTPKHEEVWFEDIDLQEVAGQHLEYLLSDEDKSSPMSWDEFLAYRAQVFVMARGCAANDFADLAESLCDQAACMTGWEDDPEDATFQQKISTDIAYAMIWQHILDFGDPEISRKELLIKFRRFVKNFPDTKYTARAEETVAILETMVSEDEIYARKPKTPPEKMTDREKIAKLIFQLRDQNGHQWSQPGFCDIFEDPRGEESPAHQLVSMGYDAIPQLIEAIEDSRFTRSIGYGRNFHFSHYVLRIGDAVFPIIERIAHRSFHDSFTSDTIVADGKAAGVRKAVQAWWAELQKKGEKQVLMETVMAGGRNAPEQALLLAERYPDVFLHTIVKGIASATDKWIRCKLILIAGNSGGNDADELLLKQMEEAPSLDERVAAAMALHRRGREEPVPAMIGEWQIVRTKGWEAWQTWYTEPLILFLATCDSPDAVRALGRQFSHWPADMRLMIVEAFDKGPFPSRSGFLFLVSSTGIEREDREEPFSPDTHAAAEELLVAALSDRGTPVSQSRGLGNPRICDSAGLVLEARWPEKYTFDLSGTLKTRNRRLVELSNIWRREKGMPLLALPVETAIQPADEREMKPLLNRLLEAESEDERSKAEQAIALLGLPALPAVLEKLETLEKTTSNRQRLYVLARHLACIVTEIFVEEDSLELPPNLQVQFEALKGRSLTAEEFTQLLITGLKTLPPDGIGIRLTADRDENPYGVTLTVRLTPLKGSEGRFIGWHQLIFASIAGRSFHDSIGSDSSLTPESMDFYDVSTAIDEVITADPLTPFEVWVQQEKRFEYTR